MPCGGAGISDGEGVAGEGVRAEGSRGPVQHLGLHLFSPARLHGEVGFRVAGGDRGYRRQGTGGGSRYGK